MIHTNLRQQLLDNMPSVGAWRTVANLESAMNGDMAATDVDLTGILVVPTGEGLAQTPQQDELYSAFNFRHIVAFWVKLPTAEDLTPIENLFTELTGAIHRKQLDELYLPFFITEQDCISKTSSTACMAYLLTTTFTNMPCG